MTANDSNDRHRRPTIRFRTTDSPTAPAPASAALMSKEELP